VWTEKPIEVLTHRALVKKFSSGDGEERYGLYTTARKNVVDDILPNIRTVLPNQTDHGPVHVAQVLENTGKLLQIEAWHNQLQEMELYTLILSVVFHDSGNIYGRKDHQRKVSKIYDYCRSAGGNDRQEKSIILKITESHCGEALDGSKDTLNAIGPELVALAGYPIHQQWIAAIIRFADELAEGRERTSLFMQKHHGYSGRSSVFHEYAAATTVHIDPGNERIALKYNIEVNTKISGGISKKEEARLKKLIEFCYQRIDKLDQERKYAKHYCDLLTMFKKTTVTFNFFIKGEQHNLGLPEKYTLSDLVVPGETMEKLLNDRESKFKLNNIIREIKKVARRR
jgi:hypothetical protein